MNTANRMNPLLPFQQQIDEAGVDEAPYKGHITVDTNSLAQAGGVCVVCTSTGWFSVFFFWGLFMAVKKNGTIYFVVYSPSIFLEIRAYFDCSEQVLGNISPNF